MAEDHNVCLSDVIEFIVSSEANLRCSFGHDPIHLQNE
jgi:hypothetical protein